MALTKKHIESQLAAISAARAEVAELAKLGQSTPEDLAELAKTSRITGEDGLFLKLWPKGGAHAWYFAYTWGTTEDGRPARKEISFGALNLSGKGKGLSLEQANKKCEEAHDMLKGKDGQPPRDPSGERKKTKAAEQLDAQNASRKSKGKSVIGSFRYWADRHMNSKYQPGSAKSEWTAATYATFKSDCETKLNPAFGDEDIADITEDMILETLLGVQQTAMKRARTTGTGALHRARMTCSGVFSTAQAHKAIKTNPMVGIVKRLPKHFTEHNGAPESAQELRPVLVAIEGYPGPLLTKLALKLHVMLMQRAGMVSSMQWRHVDLDTGEWRIPARLMQKRKIEGRLNGRDHLVILPVQAVTILRELRAMASEGAEYVFPGRPGKPLSADTLNNALVVMGFERGRYTGHGLARATAMTCGCEYVGLSPDTLNAIMDHTPDDPLRDAYQRADWEVQRMDAMQKYADWLDGVREGKPEAMMKPGQADLIAARRARLALVPMAKAA